MPKPIAQEMISAISEIVEDDPVSESMAAIKTQQLLRDGGGTHLTAHRRFLKFCKISLKTEPELVFGYKLLPSLATMRKFAFFCAATRQRRKLGLKLSTVAVGVAMELRVLRCISTIDFLHSDTTQLFRFIYNNLRTMFNLSTTPEAKVTANFGDFKVIVRHISSTEFLATLPNMMEALVVLLFINLYIDTGSRGADLLYDQLKTDPSGIKWRDVKFYLLPSKVEPTKVVFAAEVNYLVTKLTKSSRIAKPSLLMELPDIPLAFDTAALLFSLALISGVFPSNISWDGLHQKRLKTAEAIPTNVSKANDYVFPNCKLLECNHQEGFRIHRMRLCLSMIGKELGFLDNLVPYALRRMVGNAADKDADVSIMQRRQLMGHTAGSNVFQRHYIDTLLHVDVQNLTRDLDEDRVFVDGICGYSARRIRNVEQHKLALESLVEKQDDIIFLIQKRLDIQNEYNSKYGSKRAASKADPELVNEGAKVELMIKCARDAHRRRFSRQLGQKTFDFRLASLLEKPSTKDHAAPADEQLTGKTLETIEGRHLSEWLLEVGDRSMAVSAVTWFFSRPHSVESFYPGMGCKADGKCPVCHIPLSEIKYYKRPLHLVNCRSYEFTGEPVDRPMKTNRMARSAAFCFICFSLVLKTDWLAHNSGHLEYVNAMVARSGFDCHALKLRYTRPGICPFCLKDGIVTQSTGGFPKHVLTHIHNMQKDAIKSVCPCGDNDLAMSWDVMIDHFIDTHGIPLPDRSLRGTDAASNSSQDPETLDAHLANEIAEPGVGSRYPLDPEYFTSSAGTFTRDTSADWP